MCQQNKSIMAERKEESIFCRFFVVLGLVQAVSLHFSLVLFIEFVDKMMLRIDLVVRMLYQSLSTAARSAGDLGACDYCCFDCFDCALLLQL